MMSLENRLRRKERVLAQQVSGTLVLLNLDDGHYHALNRVAARVWDLCDGTRSVSDVVSVLCQEYDAPAEMIQVDVLELLEDLTSEKLVVEGS